jgi:hypothetical protein
MRFQVFGDDDDIDFEVEAGDDDDLFFLDGVNDPFALFQFLLEFKQKRFNIKFLQFFRLQYCFAIGFNEIGQPLKHKRNSLLIRIDLYFIFFK